MTAPVIAAGRTNVEGFSVTHAAILDGTTAAEETDIFGVRTASLAPDLGSVDNTGDDAVLSTWSWLNFATLNVESGFIALALASRLSGTDIEVDGDTLSLPLWQADAGNQPPFPALIRMASRDRQRRVLFLDFVLFSVQFGPMTFGGPAYKTGLTVSYAGKALLSETNELGEEIDKPAIGRIVSSLAV